MANQIFNLDGMTAEEINAARRAGQLDELIAGRKQSTTLEGEER